jgi:hypothetical protein
MDQKPDSKKVVTRKMMSGVKPGIVLAPCPDMGKLPYAEAVKLNEELNAKAQVSVALGNGDTEGAIALFESLGHKVIKDGLSKPEDDDSVLVGVGPEPKVTKSQVEKMNKTQLTELALKMEIVVEDEATNAEIKALINEKL